MRFGHCTGSSKLGKGLWFMSSPCPHETASRVGDNGELKESCCLQKAGGRFPFVPVPGLSVQEGQEPGSAPGAEWRWGRPCVEVPGCNHGSSAMGRIPSEEEEVTWQLRPAQQTCISQGETLFLRPYCWVRPEEGQRVEGQDQLLPCPTTPSWSCRRSLWPGDHSGPLPIPLAASRPDGAGLAVMVIASSPLCLCSCAAHDSL